MNRRARQVLAANLRKVVEHFCIGSRYSARAWAVDKVIDPKLLHRAMTQATAATVDTLEQLADAAGVEPWVLLHPAFDPKKPPMPASASVMGQSIARTLDGIADPERRARAYALMVQLAEFEAVAPPAAAPAPPPSPAPAAPATRPRARHR